MTDFDDVILSLILWNSTLFTEAIKLHNSGVITVDFDDHQIARFILILWFSFTENEQLVFVDKSGPDI